MRFPEFAKNDDWLSLKIYEVCKITTGTFDANAMSNSGKFPFFTCAKKVYRIDKYTFDVEALLVSGNGANVGYIHYCNGKFSAYQRTYVLWDFNINIFFVKYFLEGFLKARIFKERRDGNTPYIVLDTLRKFNLYAPKLEEQSKIANFLSLIDKRIELQNKIIKDYELLKKLLMNKFLSNFNLREISIYSLVKSQLIRIIKASELKKFNGTKSYLSTSSIDENGSISPEKEISFFDRPSRASMIPYRNSVWFAKMKDTNKVYISKNNDEEKYILSTGFYGILPIENDIDPIWLFEIFKSKYFIVQKDKLSEGGTMSGIKDSQLNELNIKIWLDKEMQNFACKLLKSFTKIIEIELGKENSLIKLKSYLLKTLFI